MFGTPKSLLIRCLEVQTPTHKLFGCLAYLYPTDAILLSWRAWMHTKSGYMGVSQTGWLPPPISWTWPQFGSPLWNFESSPPHCVIQVLYRLYITGVLVWMQKKDPWTFFGLSWQHIATLWANWIWLTGLMGSEIQLNSWYMVNIPIIKTRLSDTTSKRHVVGRLALGFQPFTDDRSIQLGSLVP